MANEMVVTLQANLTADPERKTVGGKEIASLNLAHNTQTKKAGKYEDDDPWYINATVWARYEGDRWPDNVAESLSKGMTVDVTGRLKREPYTTREGREGVSYRLSVQSIGPSLQRATAAVQKSGGGGSAAGGGAASGWGAAQGQSTWGQPAAPAPAPAAATAAADGYAAPPAGASALGGFGGGFDDEQPF